MTELILDIGNTRIKAALFRNGRLLRLTAFGSGPGPALRRFIEGFQIDRVGIGSVAGDADGLLSGLPDGSATIHLITTNDRSPIRSAYSSPATLGIDRWANAAAAAALFPQRAAFAIDLGTCITYDLVDSTGTYLGGAISPGTRMRAKAMQAYSARLPLVETDQDAPPFGQSTVASLQAGIRHGVIGELEHFIAAAQQAHPGVGVVLTGGDALLHARALKSGIFAHPFLTLDGLRIILHHSLGAGTASGTGSGSAG